MAQRTKYSFRKRQFLHPLTSEFDSYVSALCESSRDGEYAQGNYMLIIADCHRRIELDFYLGTAQRRYQSLRKIDLLLDTLTAFRDTLRAEAKAIQKRR